MAKPTIRKNGDVWTVHINGRAWNTRRTWEDAMVHAHRIAEYAHRIRFKRDIERITASLERIKENR